MTPRFTRTIPTLRIFDSGKAREFYIGFLGFKVDFEHRFEPDLPLFMQISLGGRRSVFERAPRRLLAWCKDRYRNLRPCRLPRRFDREEIRICSSGACR